jgi:hypothetical protein
LKPRKKPYFRSIEAGRHIGYYKRPRGRTWLARTGDAGRYRELKLAIADDVRDPNGVDVLSFAQAQAAAPDWFDRLVCEDDVNGPAAGRTFRKSVESYIATRNARESARQGRPMTSSASYKLRRYVLTNNDFADIELRKLTVAALRK